jgi:hypothetical protein
MAEVAVIGELSFEDARGVWKAEIEHTVDGGYAFYLTVGSSERLSGGMFDIPEAAVKFIRSQAEKRFGRHATPLKDSLHKIAKRKGAAVIPTCLQKVADGSPESGGRGLEQCPRCPYRSMCGNATNVMQPQGTTKTEADESFLERLRRKTAAMGKV